MNIKSILAIFLSTLILAVPAFGQETQGSIRVMAITAEAEIVDVNQETREFTLRSPTGELNTITAGADIERFEEIAIGDIVSATYTASLAGEVREPTAAELLEPWIELDGAAKAGLDMDPAAVAGRVIQAVCTIEGMNRVAGTVMVLDPRGKYHLIGDVDPARMEGITLGTTVILTYSEAVALALVKQPAAAE